MKKGPTGSTMAFGARSSVQNCLSLNCLPIKGLALSGLMTLISAGCMGIPVQRNVFFRQLRPHVQSSGLWSADEGDGSGRFGVRISEVASKGAQSFNNYEGRRNRLFMSMFLWAVARTVSDIYFDSELKF